MTTEKVSYETFKSECEHYEKRIVLPYINRHIDKVGCFKNGSLDYDEIERLTKIGYEMYLNQ